MVFLKAALGAIIMVIITLLSGTRNYYIAGLVPLFPTFTLIAHYTVGMQRTHEELKQTILFSICALIPYMVYLFASYILIDKTSVRLALFFSAVLWCITACILLFAWTHLRH